MNVLLQGPYVKIKMKNVHFLMTPSKDDLRNQCHHFKNALELQIVIIKKNPIVTNYIN
jgi:hypothetical protein